MTVYLDHNATTPLRPEARAAMLEAMAHTGNPSSAHGPGRAARRILERAREQVAALAGADPAWVTFTSGATEACALALNGWAHPVERMVSALEHPAVSAAAPNALRIAATRDGVVDLAALERMLDEARTQDAAAPLLVSVMAVNNETGVIQPTREAARLARTAGAWFHCDAAQAAGKIPLDMLADGCNLMSLSAHKLGGPMGAGALVARPDLPLVATARGGGQERGRRGGTENLCGAAGFGAAADAVGQSMPTLHPLRDALERRLRAACPDAIFVGAGAARVDNTTCVAVPGVAADRLVMAMDLAGVAVSAGAACASGKVGRSAALAAMGLPDWAVDGAIRISLGWTTTADDVDRAAEAWAEAVRRMRDIVGYSELSVF